MSELEMGIADHIRNVPNFPKEGIQFKDITPILENPALCQKIAKALIAPYHGKIDAIVGVESRGFLFGLMMAQLLNCKFIPIRKKGKLPYKTISYSYSLEYGTATMEMHVDAIKPNDQVIIHDDLLATGGTAAAAAELVLQQGGAVAGFSFIVGLDFLNGKMPLQKYKAPILTLINY
jgi:adenine phosphoribosyltransferase